MATVTQNGDMARMQRDAENRIREMQRKADRAVKGNDTPPVPNFVRMNPQRASTPQPQRPAQPPEPHPTLETPPRKGGILSQFKGIDFLKLFNFKNMHIDSDITIIIALLLLLSTEDADELLVLALIYIML